MYQISLEHLLRQKTRNCSKKNRDMSRDHRSQLEWAPTGQIRKNLSIKTKIINGAHIDTNKHIETLIRNGIVTEFQNTSPQNTY